jgi:diketogulonate reductase-like aldo/keto reductase
VPGREIPSIAFGTSRLGNGQWTVDAIDQAIWVGFSHIGECPLPAFPERLIGRAPSDTAQIYGNEVDAGAAIRESGLKREEIWVTTKYSGVGGLSIREAFNESLNKVVFSQRVHACIPMASDDHSGFAQLGVTFVDLYLIHFPKVALPDIPTAWKEMERLHAEGLAK